MRLLLVLAVSSLVISSVLALPQEKSAASKNVPVAAAVKAPAPVAAEAKQGAAYQPAQARDGAHHHDHDHDDHDHGAPAYGGQPQVPAYQPQPYAAQPQQQYNAPAVPAYPQQAAPAYNQPAPQAYSQPAPQAYSQPAPQAYNQPAPQQYAAAPAYQPEAPVYGAGPAASHQPESYAAAPQSYAPEAHHAPAPYQAAPAYQAQKGYEAAPAYSAPSHPGYYYYYYPVQDSGKKKFKWPKIKMPKIPGIGGYGAEYKGLIGVGLAAIILLIVFGGTLLALPIIGIGRRSLESVWESEYLSKDNLNHMASLVLNAIDKYQSSIVQEKLE